MTTYLAKNHGTVVIEDLNVSGMFANHKLGKSITDQGFYEFRRQLEYKCQWYGTKLVIVDLIFPSSKTCPNCGHVQDMPLNLRTYDCPDCGLSILLRLKRKYKFKTCGRLDRECLWMSNRRRPQLKQEVNINLSRYVTLCIIFIKHIFYGTSLQRNREIYRAHLVSFPSNVILGSDRQL